MQRTAILFMCLCVGFVHSDAPDPARIPSIPAGHQPFEALPRFFDTHPQATFLTDGHTLEIRVRTRVSTPPGILYYGHREETGHNRYRFYAKEITTDDSDSLLHRFEVPFDEAGRNSLENLEFDVTGLAKVGGVVGVRALFHNPQTREPEQYDWEIRYSKSTQGQRVIEASLDRGPYFDTHSPRHGAISAVLSEPATSTVSIAPFPCQNFIQKTAFDLRPEFHFHNLKPDTRYCARFAVANRNGTSETLKVWQFKTFSEKQKPLRIAFMSDSRSGHGGGDSKVQGTNYGSIVNLFNIAARRGTDAIVFAGDLIDGYTSDLTHLKQSLRAFQRASGHYRHHLPLFAGMGNHEAYVTKFRSVKGAALQPWKGNTFTIPAQSPSMEEVFSQEFINPLNGPLPEAPGLPPYQENVYFVVLNGVALVMLNTNYWYSHDPETLGGNLEGYIMDRQLEWFRETISALHGRSDVRAILTFIHEPAFPNSFHRSNAMYYHGGNPAKNGGLDRTYVIERRDQFWSILSNTPKSVAVFAGDEHNYSRILIAPDSQRGYVHPVWQIVSGGVGAPYYAKLDEVPWSDQVSAFHWHQHLVIVDVNLSEVRLRAIDSTGQTIDSLTLRKL